jgi:hypothetical protein
MDCSLVFLGINGLDYYSSFCGVFKYPGTYFCFSHVQVKRHGQVLKETIIVSIACLFTITEATYVVRQLLWTPKRAD